MNVFSTSSPSVQMENVWSLTFKPPTFLHFVVTEFRENFSSSYFTFFILFYLMNLSTGTFQQTFGTLDSSIYKASKNCKMF